MRQTVWAAAAAGGAGAVLCLAAVAPAAAGVQGDPPGNNGTVKIDGVPFDDHPDNEPHVGCVFQVDFYGFDQGDLDATVTFTLVPPTGDGVDITVDDVPIGEDAAGGGTDLDAAVTYDLATALADVEAHPQQGIHLRLTVHAEGSQGADTKHKVFWVTGCGKPPTSTTTTTKPGHGTTTTTSTSTPGGSTTTTAPTTPTTRPDDGGGTTTSPTSESPGGHTTTVPTGPGGGNGAAGQLPETGSDAAPLAAAGLALVAAGGVAGLAARHLRSARTARTPG